ncbi:hypothetical protein DY000_02024571 [Brassica cretica]|uniref:Uncharacterized protein n=1 Tax=Brassica cretica TaxID=69181 RepID=A0ABQ7EDE2_BRACR|nr:hypothetical protein DY000_02024571 [Brassica cretica]
MRGARSMSQRYSQRLLRSRQTYWASQALFGMEMRNSFLFMFVRARGSRQCNIRYPTGRSVKACKECDTGLDSYFQDRIPRGIGPPCPARRQTRSGPRRDGMGEPN